MKKAFLILLTFCFLLTACGEPARETSGEVDVGPEAYRPDSGEISISELMADNDAFVMGCADDWVELYNDGDSDVKLTGCSLIKRSAGETKAIPLDEYVVPAKGFFVLRLTEGQAFRLTKDGDTVMLVSGGQLLDQLSFDASIGISSWSHSGVCEYPTPGFPNTAEGYSEYLKTVTVPGLRINEVMSSNSKFSPVDDKFYDLVEIYNGTDKPIDLSGYYLSDKKTEPQRYRFPEYVLEPDGYFVVYCSGLTGDNHAPFRISSEGESVFLSTDYGFVDCIRVPGDVKKNESYGRNGSSLVYMAVPTPGARNAEGYSHRPSVPTASVPSGAYGEPFTVALSASGEIRYTLDGTEPNESSRLYSEPISVDGVVSIRALAFEDGIPSDVTSFFYLVGIEHAYPVVNVAIKSEYLRGSEGVINHVEPEYEHEAYVTMMDQGVECFSAPCGFKLHGNGSKELPKQNFQLRFRSVYGMSKLHYKVFENRDAEVFNSLLLKGGSEDYNFCCFRDELATSLADGATNLAVQAYRPVILYLNGEYWGFYWLRERYDAEYCSQRLGVSEDSINMLKDYGDSVVRGSGKDYQDLVKYCREHDLRNQADYEYVTDRIDVLSIMDWYICRSYVGDVDLANIRFYNSTEDDGKWHWCYFDLDWSFWNDTEDPIGRTARNDGHHDIMLALLRNPDFRDRFLRRYAELMRTVLNEEHILSEIDRFTAILEPEIEQDRAKYGLTVERWRSSIENLKNYVRGGKRETTVLAGLKKYFGLSSDQMNEYFGRG